MTINEYLDKLAKLEEAREKVVIIPVSDSPLGKYYMGNKETGQSIYFDDSENINSALSEYFPRMVESLVRVGALDENIDGLEIYKSKKAFELALGELVEKNIKVDFTKILDVEIPECTRDYESYNESYEVTQKEMQKFIDAVKEQLDLDTYNSLSEEEKEISSILDSYKKNPDSFDKGAIYEAIIELPDSPYKKEVLESPVYLSIKEDLDIKEDVEKENSSNKELVKTSDSDINL